MRQSCARAAAFIRRTFSFALATAEARVPPMQLRGGGARQDGILASEIAHGIDCQCYFSDNFFVPNRGHYVFHGARQFKVDHAAELREMGPAASEELLQRLEREAARRRTAAVAAADRKRRVAAAYAPRHPELWELREEFLHADFVSIVRRARAGESVTLDALADGVYPLPVFSESFCARLCEEVAHFDASALPRGRPNSMNNAGVLLDELGLSPGLLGPLLRDYLGPLCAALPPLAAAGGSSLSHHKAFVVRYKLGEDEHLEEHYDNSEVTLNVNLGLDFEQGELLFHGRKGAPRAPLVAHEWSAGVGHGVLHVGEQVHAALPITAGERLNLVVWMRSPAHRRAHGCPMCGSTERLSYAPQ